MKTNAYPIMYWFGPSAADKKSIGEIAAAGFTRIPVEGKDKEDNIRIIKLCANAGIEAMVTDRRITEAIGNPKERDSLLAQVAGDYKGFENVKAYYITDEPSCDDFEALGGVCAVLKKLDPDRETYINLFPNYASSEQLKAESYKKHIDLYVDIVKPEIISYDHYHFVGRESESKKSAEPAKTNERERLIRESAWNTEQREGFFDNIEIIRDKSLETGIPFMVIVLVAEHGPYRNLSEAEIRWEVFQSLAYGSSRISYFTYGTPEYDESWRYTNAMANKDGSLTRHYYEVMRINKDLSIPGAYLAGKKSTGVFHIGEEADKLIKPYEPAGGISDIKTTGGVTLGFFEGGEIMLANKSYINVNKIDISTHPSKTVSVLDKTSGQWYNLIKSGNACAFTLTLMPGDGELIKISRVQN